MLSSLFFRLNIFIFRFAFEISNSLLFSLLLDKIPDKSQKDVIGSYNENDLCIFETRIGVFHTHCSNYIVRFSRIKCINGFVPIRVRI